MTTPTRPGLRRCARQWPWLALGLVFAAALWHDLDFPDDLDREFPAVARPTFNPLPPPAYRLAEPGDTIDRVAVYLSAAALVVSLAGWARAPGRRRPWLGAVAASAWALWYASAPGPTADGWHGLGGRSALDPAVPLPWRVGLGLATALLAGLAAWGLGPDPSRLWREARGRGVAGLFAAALALLAIRQVEIPGLGPPGYWPRWALVGSLVLFASALVRLAPALPARRPVALGGLAAGVAVWFGLVTAGVALSWYHRPLARLREVVPGRIYISAMPTARGLPIAQARHHFKTIINLFPEDTDRRSPRLDDEVKFAREHGVRYLRSPSDAAPSDDFLDLTLREARDPAAWPILVHCHGCMDRTPAWVGVYRFVVEGQPLAEVMRFIEAHRGYRPKASVTLLYNRVLPRLAPGRYRDDPAAAVLRRAAAGTADPYYDQLRAERGARAVAPEVASGSPSTPTAGARPSLTPRR